MAEIHDKIEKYLDRTPDWVEEVIIFDDLDDKGLYIKEWRATDKPKPTQEELDALWLILVAKMESVLVVNNPCPNCGAENLTDCKCPDECESCGA